MKNHLPSPLDQIPDKFVSLHGDRVETDALVLAAGLAWIGSHRVVLVAGTQVDQTLLPSSLRQFRRLAELAGRLGRPLLLWEPSQLLQPVETSLRLLQERHPLLSELALLSVPILVVASGDESRVADCFVPIRENPDPGSLRNAIVREIAQCLQRDPMAILRQRRERLENALDNRSAQ